jgi:hypothetical protein
MAWINRKDDNLMFKINDKVFDKLSHVNVTIVEVCKPDHEYDYKVDGHLPDPTGRGEHYYGWRKDSELEEKSSAPWAEKVWK